MKENRTIRSIEYAATYNMGGFPVRQAFPTNTIQNIDPFLLLHHADVKVPANIPLSQAGVGPHPHRGFAPVTFIFEGGVHHRDSRGNDNVVYKGGVQWMNAGMGIIHSERPPKDIFELGGRQEIIQLWVNMPSKNKMDQPSYFPLTAEDIPFIESEDKQTRINIVSGELDGIKGITPTLSAVNTFTVEMKQGARYSFSIPSTHNAFIYLLDGELKINESNSIKGKYAAVFNNDGNGFDIEATANTRFFIGSGEPLNEPIASHGPFVMNNETQIMEAFRDYQMGKMGVLIED